MINPIKMNLSGMENYITNLMNRRMKQINDSLEILDSQKKDELFYVNALISIQRVIDHFDTVKEAFDDLSLESLIEWGNHNYHFRFFVNYMFDEGEVPKYTHYFDVYNFKTNYIISPLVKTFKNYNTISECTVNLTEEGVLISVVFSEDVTSHDNKKVSLTYNDLFELVSIRRSYQKTLTGETMLYQKSYCESLEIENYFIDLFLRGYCDKKTHEILPEFTIPSAYDFNSDEFNIRLKLAEMIFI